MTICKSFNEGYSLADWVRIYPLNKAPKPQILVPYESASSTTSFHSPPTVETRIRRPFPGEKTLQLAVDVPGRGHLPIHVVSTQSTNHWTSRLRLSTELRDKSP
uniref:Uncharacterized protein n=1 Tax=Cacopsylla melanoneura TaxID=428564 RepID=A0A8D9E4L5_9HEMI